MHTSQKPLKILSNQINDIQNKKKTAEQTENQHSDANQLNSTYNHTIRQLLATLNNNLKSRYTTIFFYNFPFLLLLITIQQTSQLEQTTQLTQITIPRHAKELI